MAPGRDWIVADIDDDAVAAAKAAARSADLTVDEWMRRAIVEAYRREALTPPAVARDATVARDEAPGETAAMPAPASEPAPELPLESPPEPAPELPLESPPEPAPELPLESPPEPAAAPGGPAPRAYQPISPGTARIIGVGRLAVGFLLLIVIAAVGWYSQDLWLGQDSEPTTTAEPNLATLPTERVPILPAHEAPDPQDTKRAVVEPTAKPEAAPAQTLAAIETAGAGEVESLMPTAEEPEAAPPASPETEAPPATVAIESEPKVLATEGKPETPVAAADTEGESETPVALESEAPVATEAETPATAATEDVPEIAVAAIAVTEPLVAGPDAEQAPATEDEGPIVVAAESAAEPATAPWPSPDETVVESQTAARTPPPGTSYDDVPESVVAFIEAATAGDPDAQHDLALIYVQGLGVPRDQEAAAYWFAQAAEQGNANAQYNLGVMYEQGMGVPRDQIEALLLYLTAAGQGHVAAQYNAGLAYAEGKSVPRDFAEAHRWFSAAAEQGLVEAQYNLGIIYENGLDRARDDVTAYRYYSLAARSGHQDAERKLAVVSVRLTDAQRAFAEREAADLSQPGAKSKDMSMLDRGEVRELQGLLQQLGYDTGAADGLSGGQTETAIRHYQQSAGLLVDGRPTAALLEHLRDTAEQ